MALKLDRQSERLAALTAQLGQLNPDAVLARGYGIVRDAAGRVIVDSRTVAVGDALSVTLRRGELAARVEAKRED